MSGNTLGTLFTVTNFGESHGPAIGCVIDGCPPGMALTEADIQVELDRRRPGTSRHVTQRQEADQVEILSGVFEGVTTGTPIALLIRNTDQRSKDYGNIAQTFRPGHADYTYWQKYGVRDYRGGGRSSARLTAPTVAAGAVAKKWLREKFGLETRGCMSALGEIEIPFVDWQHVPRESVLLAECRDRAAARSVHGRTAPRWRFGRRAHRNRCVRRAGRSRRAAVRPAGRGHRPRDDGPQCSEGGRDRRGLRERRATRLAARRRDDARRLRGQQCGRHSRRHFERAGHHGVDRDQADVEHSHAASVDRQGRARARPSRPSAVTIRASAFAPRRSPRRCSRSC